MDEFLTAICAVRHKSVVNKFFANFDKEKHQYADGYIYDSIMKLDLKDHFIITARYLKYYDKNAPLYIGYDPVIFQAWYAVNLKNMEKNLGY